jgi:hypothetical protein
VNSTTLTSSLDWLDLNADDRRKMIEVVSLFKLRETRDELGLGSIRDVFSELLFPGTGTMQTRARYFLFVPWIYKRLERIKVPSAKLQERLKREEARLIPILMQNDADGVIGRRSGANLTRFPSNVYWNGYWRWGIFQHKISQSQYHRSLDRFYLQRKTHRRTDDGDPLDWSSENNWDPHLPEAPANFPDGVTLKLRKVEAEYLREKIQLGCADSMLPFLIEAGVPVAKVEFAWMHPGFASFPGWLQDHLNHARCFSELMLGAALLYNYSLAKMDDRESLVQIYSEDLDAWRKMIGTRFDALRSWDRTQFWNLVRSRGRIPVLTQQFVNHWLDLVLAGSQAPVIEGSKQALKLVREREMMLKRGRSRFQSKRHRELWGGASGNFQLDFRWWVARRIANDLIEGLDAQ